MNCIQESGVFCECTQSSKAGGVIRKKCIPTATAIKKKIMWKRKGKLEGYFQYSKPQQ